MQDRTIEEWQAEFNKKIAENRVFVFAKGEKNMAMCGFSNRVMQIFNALDVPFEVQNIFQAPNIREAICTQTNWPTIPQIFVDGKFIGGCDIVTELYQNGELKQMLEAQPTES